MNLFKDRRPFLGQDPHIVDWNGDKLLIQSAYGNKRLVIKQARFLEDLQKAPSQTVWIDPTQNELWAPELHQIDNLWYIYFAAATGQNQTHRTYVLEADTPLGPYHSLGKVFDPNSDEDFWSIDTTIFEHDGQRYAAWSGWPSEFAGFPQHLYLAALLAPNRIGTRILLASPHFNWEKSIAPILEGPQVIKTQEKLFMTYSANASWTNDYCVGLLEYTGGPILDPDSWVKARLPILKGGGHGSFIGDKYIYHRKLSHEHGWADREIVCATVTWDANGCPQIKTLRRAA